LGCRFLNLARLQTIKIALKDCKAKKWVGCLNWQIFEWSDLCKMVLEMRAAARLKKFVFRSKKGSKEKKANKSKK
jgi:hypothetical protein